MHIPFCRRACFYCHFYKVPFRPEHVEAYIDAVGIESRLRSGASVTADTVYIGGGSPSLLSPAHLDGLLSHIQRSFSVEPKAEITVECNPEDVSLPLLEGYLHSGVNRLSIGTQSFIQDDLDVLRRPHSAEQSVHAVELAFQAGFRRINIDYILGVPGQTPRSLEGNLRMAGQLSVSHVSTYLLEEVREESEEEDERDRELYTLTELELERMGFEHYEVSNFAKPGQRSRHNMKYWENQSYIGLGASASGFIDGWDYKNVEDLDEYLRHLRDGRLPELESAEQDLDTRAIVMGLRLMDGLPERNFRRTEHREALDFLLDSGMLVRRGKHIAVALDHILLLNEILGYFI